MSITQFYPRKIREAKTAELFSILMDYEEAYPALGSYIDTLLEKGWRFYVVDQRRGHCLGTCKVITIPLWVMNKELGMLLWYVAHECAHAKAGPNQGHNHIFMEALKSLCPKEFQHYELDYKPKQAMAAGIVPEDF